MVKQGLQTMADPKRKLKKIITEKGTIQGAAGILDAIFGTLYSGSGTQASRVGVDRQSHPRVVEIGKPSVSVDGAVYLTKKYKGNPNGGPRGGEPVSVMIGGVPWEVRIGMTHDEFSEILVDHSILGGEIFWNSQRGTTYGPLRINALP